MENVDNLLKLIEEGNEVKILSQMDLTETFNILCKYDLIEIKDQGIFLTQDGVKAKREGAENFILWKEKIRTSPTSKIKKKNIFLQWIRNQKEL